MTTSRELVLLGGLVVASVSPALAARPPSLVGRWTFDGPDPLADTTGNWGPLRLESGAHIADGALRLGEATTPDAWAWAAEYRGPTIRTKTLVAWVAVANPDVTAGSVLSLDTVDSSDVFDGIVWAEAAPRTWMVGSNYYSRTQALVATPERTFGRVLQMALVTEPTPEGAQYTLCRDGVALTTYEDGPVAEWAAGNAEVVLGARHTISQVPVGGRFWGWVEEARVYAAAMSCAEVGALRR